MLSRLTKIGRTDANAGVEKANMSRSKKQNGQQPAATALITHPIGATFFPAQSIGAIELYFDQMERDILNAPVSANPQESKYSGPSTDGLKVFEITARDIAAVNAPE